MVTIVLLFSYQARKYISIFQVYSKQIPSISEIKAYAEMANLMHSK